MANELLKSGTAAVVKQGSGASVKHAKKAAKKSAKKAGKKAAKKSSSSASSLKSGSAQGGLRTAFHHMQRAAVVISLMEKGSGEDLRELLERGVKLYEKALEGDDAAVLKAVGLLRAAEHLALAGLYDARHKHRAKVEPPRGPWLESFAAETSARLGQVEGKGRGKGKDVFPGAEELVRRALEAAGDPHLAWELAMAADALCFALESGL